ncbi:MAG: phage tail fiber [Planctomycetota bacterium]|nr:MAG: phage tail fiber [Planctomycetota bacterium]
MRSSLRGMLAWCFIALGTMSLAADPEPNPTNGKPVGVVRLLLPASIPAVVGQECNVYFDNVVLVPNPTNFVFDAVCSKGRQQVERWTWTPTEADVGEHSLQIDVRDAENRVIASAKTVVRVVATNRNEGKPLSVLCVGDSLTHASAYTQRLLDLSDKPGNPKLTLVGSHWTGDKPGPNRHEGYGGWTAKRFATHFTENARSGDYKLRGSPFLYRGDDGKPVLDFARYCRDVNEGRLPDVVTICLGPNDIFSFNDDTIEGGIDDMLKHFDLLIEMLRKQASSTKVAILLPLPPAATQDAFGSNYASGQTRWQYKRNQHRLVEQMLERYAGRESDLVHVVPAYVSLDCVHNYPAESVSANSTNETKIVRQNNGVHPAASGYHQIGDMLFAWLKSL